jgi:hypothetical protein
MSSSGGTAEAGEASSSSVRSGVAQLPEVTGAGPIVRLPEDSLAVEWWLARRALEDARLGDGGVPYATDGVLALWPERRAETDTWTFGLEFEFAAADAGWVASELHQLGLCASAEPVPYHSERPAGFWSVEHDRTVTSVFTSDNGEAPVIVGGEVVSPPLRDTAAAWQQVATVLDVLARCGAQVNRTCGLHVHIGADALHDPAAATHAKPDPALRAAHEPARDLLPALSRLAMLASVCFEDLVFRLASAEGGRHRGQAFFYRHCRPLEGALATSYETLTALTDALGLDGASRRAALNLTNVGDPLKDTVEFRQCNGTLDGRVVQAFVRLAVALVGAARWEPAAAHLSAEPLGTHLATRASTADAEATENFDPAPLWRFLAAAFPNGLPAEAAASLLWLFRRGTWQPSLSALASA